MQLNIRKSLTVIAFLSGMAAMPAWADHMSVWGAGWANMPNDVHNTRIEDDLTQDEWVDFIQYGDGASTPNRYLDSTDLTGAGSMAGGAAMGPSITTSTMGGSRR